MNINYEVKKEEALTKLYKIFRKEMIDNAFVGIFDTEDSCYPDYKVISFMNDLYEIGLTGENVDEEYIQKYWSLYKDTLKCNVDALSDALRDFGRAAQDSVNAISRFEMLKHDKTPLWKQIFWNKGFLKFIGLLAIIYGVHFLWVGLELFFYNEIQPRMVDNFIAIILWCSLYFNWSKWVDKKMK